MTGQPKNACGLRPRHPYPPASEPRRRLRPATACPLPCRCRDDVLPSVLVPDAHHGPAPAELTPISVRVFHESMPLQLRHFASTPITMAASARSTPITCATSATLRSSRALTA